MATLLTLGSFSAYWFFHNIYLSIVIAFYGILVLIAAGKKPKTKSYELGHEEISLDNGAFNISYEDIKSYNIDLDHFKILINSKNVFRPFLITIPFEKTQNIKKIDKFLASKIKKDETLKIPIGELWITNFMGI